MHLESLDHWQHEHAFGQEVKREGERRTLIVIAITATMMVVEIAAGIAFGSMALLADGLHMGSHAVALAISVIAYMYARIQARSADFSFGTGKVNALGGYTGAVLLAVFALMMGYESCHRLLSPVPIAFNQAIFVAVLGLVVNGASVIILGHGEEVEHDHAHHGSSHAAHGPGDAHAHAHPHPHPHHHHDHADEVVGMHDVHGGHQDHNLRSAYLHVMADALTSVLAIVALLFGKFMGLMWMDPLMGIVGAILVARWSIGLLASSSAVLLDRQGPSELQAAIRAGIEDSDSRVADLHVWAIGPGIYSAVLSVVAHAPLRAEQYKSRVAALPGLHHITIEVHECEAHA